MSADDPVDETAMIFTEADVFMIVGFLADRWGIEEDVTEETEEAITAVLAEQREREQ
jgi:hypothetical protein